MRALHRGRQKQKACPFPLLPHPGPHHLSGALRPPGHPIVEFPGALGLEPVYGAELEFEDSQGLGMRALLVRVLEFTLHQLGGCQRAQSRGVTQFDSCFTTLTSVFTGLLCEAGHRGARVDERREMR